MQHWRRADPDLTLPDGRRRRFNPHLRCGGKCHRCGVAGVNRQRRRHHGVCEQIGDHRPPGHTVVPIQRVLGKLAAFPHFPELCLIARPASLALHIDVDVHGFSVPSGEKPTKDQRLRFGFRSCSGRLRSTKLCKNLANSKLAWVSQWSAGVKE